VNKYTDKSLETANKCPYICTDKTINRDKNKEMTTIKQEILDRLDGNTKAVARLAYEFGKHQTSIERWIKEKNQLLTTPMAIKAISEELLVPENEILTES
jgi:hypothetical protein